MSTTNETCKPQGVDQNKMYTLKDLSQSMFENIESGVVKANEPVYPIRNKSMNLLDGSWFTRISYADGLSTIIPYAPIRSDSGAEAGRVLSVLQGPKKNDSPNEKMCFSLYFAATKL
ncbi:hypothetical protein Tco_1390729 [Tanacetum coccineum]